MSNKNKIWNALIAGTAAVTIAGGSLALAQSTPPAPSAQNPAAQNAPAQNAPADAQRYRATPEDRAALTDARVAALKAGLKLTAEQEKSWPAVETAIRDLAKQRADRAAAMRDGRNAQAQARPDAIARLRRGADMMTERAAGLKKLADAAEPLYKTLDDGQKHRFGMLMRMGAQGGMDRGPGDRGPRGHHRRG